MLKSTRHPLPHIRNGDPFCHQSHIVLSLRVSGRLMAFDPKMVACGSAMKPDVSTEPERLFHRLTPSDGG